MNDMIGSLYNFFSKIIPAIIICTQIFDIRKFGHFERLLNRSTSSTSNCDNYFSAKLFARICHQTSYRFCSSFIALFVVRWQPYLMPKPDGCGAGNRQIVPIRKLFSNCITQKPIHPLHNQTNTIHLCTDLFVCIFRKKNNGRGGAKGVQVGGGVLSHLSL